MRRLGFETYLTGGQLSWIITTFRYPDARFHFEEFYGRLADAGHVIYPGKLTSEDCFRIGTIGRIDEADVDALLASIGRIMAGLGPFVVEL